MSAKSWPAENTGPLAGEDHPAGIGVADLAERTQQLPQVRERQGVAPRSGRFIVTVTTASRPLDQRHSYVMGAPPRLPGPVRPRSAEALNP